MPTSAQAEASPTPCCPAGLHPGSGLDAGVVQVFALKEDAGAALACCQALGKEDRAWAAHVIGVQVIQFFLEGGGFAHLS